ncbi:glycosyltransferase family 2 protein [Jannaschia aquimarina]|uniref:Glycosyl transferase family 2 n=1 Tax=Jannaschia aquimarina TaxID=935700 RepID=A0A0D1CK29_9RHOB|nr:glycosyltransferase family 2 protein [Jannaschia aquimarina]KIT15102.1 hypothetical protein jaqu_34290 [Jannaschia aquimarina]SNS64137.1 Glycosyl transferase family 2 [Jannaschia aquimarina]
MTQGPVAAYKLRLRRQRLRLRAWRKRGEIMAVSDRTSAIRPDAILCFATVRNEASRLPYWLSHHRKLGVDHFLIVDNESDDDTPDLLGGADDVSLWTTPHSYKAARFGMDWLTLLQMRHAHRHWCLTLDADELWIHPHHTSRDLKALTWELDRRGQDAMGALMLDLYPGGPLDAALYGTGDDPVATLPWFDSGNYVWLRQEKLQNLWVQGGPRARAFFATEPRRAPTLSKLPLVRWNRSYAYVSSTHSILPRDLNLMFDGMAGRYMTGILLHSKFLPEIVQKSAIEKTRGEHFENSALYGRYYDSVAAAPTLWCDRSTRMTGWQQLEGLGLMTRAGWE